MLAFGLVFEVGHKHSMYPSNSLPYQLSTFLVLCSIVGKETAYDE